VHCNRHFVHDFLNRYDIHVSADAEIVNINDSFGGDAIYVCDKTTKVLIKKINNSYTDNRKLFHLNYQKKMNFYGISCPRIFITKKDELFVKIYNDFFYLQSWCDGKSYWWLDLDVENRLSFRRKVGELIGNIHLLEINKKDNPCDASVLVDMHNLLAQPNKIINSFSKKWLGKFGIKIWAKIHLPSSLTKALISLLPEIYFIVKRLAHEDLYKKFDYLEQIASHGDWNYENILFKEGEISCLIDFDNARIVPRAYDVGSALAAVCFCGEHEEEFLAAYELSSGLHRPSMEVIRTCVITRILNSLLWQLVNFPGLMKNQKEKSEWWMLQLCQALERELPYHRI
jgi:thiamine kinase-like enzyme